MNVNYLKALDKLRSAKSYLEGLFKTAPEGDWDEMSFDDRKAYHILENIVDDLEKAVNKLEYFSLPVIEGVLEEDTYRQKFDLIRDDNGEGLGYQFSCGSSLEVYDNDNKTWCAGRVEHSDGRYYFYNSSLEHPALYTGMRVRVRDRSKY